MFLYLFVVSNYLCIFWICRIEHNHRARPGSDRRRANNCRCHATTTQSLFLILVYYIWYTWYESYLQSIINVHIYIIYIYIFLAFPVNLWSWQLLAKRTEPLPGITWMSVATVKVSDSASTGIHHEEMVRWETIDHAIFNALTLVVCCRSWMIFVNMPWY